MTIAADLARREHVTVSGLLSYAAAFEIKDKTHVEVWLDGTLKTYGTDYTIADSGVANPAGFTVVLTSDPGADLNLIILTNISEVQSANYLASGGFPPATTEAVFDKHTAYNKMQAEILRRVPKLAKTSLTHDITIPEPTALNLLRWNTAGDDLENINIDDLNPGIGAASGEPTVAEGVVTDTVAVSGLNDADYRVIISTNWGSGATVTAKRSDGFDVSFQFGPGVGGSTYEWILSRNTAAALAGVGAHDHTTADASGKLTNPEFDSYTVHELISAPSGNPVAGKSWAWFESGILKIRFSDGTTYTLGPQRAHSHTATATDGGAMTAPVFATYFDVLNIAAPGSPSAGYLRGYNDIADGHFKLKTSAGATVDVSAIQSVTGMYGSRGLTMTNNNGAPTTKMDMDAEFITLINSSNEIVIRANPGAALTCDLSVFGINGRDQAGAFAAGNWLYFYWIWNGTTLATRASLTGPPTGPALGGYTHWCYAAVIRYDGSAALAGVRVFGNTVFYKVRSNITTLANNDVESSIATAGIIPDGHVGLFNVRGRMDVGVAGGLRTAQLYFRQLSGNSFIKFHLEQSVNSSTVICNSPFEMPVAAGSETILYEWDTDADVTGQNAEVDVLGYKVTNGAS